MLKPFKHQEKYGQSYKDNELVVHEGGTGKTVCACLWLKDGRDENALVICPKRVVKKWEETLKAWGTKATVISKENFKKMDTSLNWSARVIDEADEFASPLFTKNRSQLSEAMYKQVMENPDTPTLLLTATPIRSNPWNLHTLLTFKGTYIDWKKWRSHFFELKKEFYLPRPAWMPKDNWRTEAARVLKKHSDIVLLKDCDADLPPVYQQFINSKPKGKFVKDIEWTETSKIFVEKHKFEQNNKVKDIKEHSKKFRKVIVVAYYRSEVERLTKELGKERLTFGVHGGTKNQEDVLKEANENHDECYLVVQASLGCSWDGDTFPLLVFTSMSYSVRDYTQMKYRIRRIHNLQPVNHLYLIGGKADQAVYDTIQLGREFVPSEWDDVT